MVGTRTGTDGAIAHGRGAAVIRNWLHSSTALTGWASALPIAVIGAGLVGATPAYANPEGANVVAGGISIDDSIPKTLTINQSTGTAIINWNSFSIKLDETTNFIQPSSSSWTLNRVTGAAGDASPWRASALTGQAGCQDGRLQGRTGHRPVDRLLQHRAAPFRFGRRDAGRSVRGRAACGYDGQGSRLAHIPTGSTTAAGCDKQDFGGMIRHRNTP